MANKDKTLDDLFFDTLRDIYHAEKQILRALSRMAKATRTDELREAFEAHREETETQIERLEKVFETIGKRPRGKPCEAIEGILEEGKEVMEDYKESAALDAGLLAGAQAVEHYEISRYGTLKAWAAQLGLNDAARLLDETLKEEERTDKKLSSLAARSINKLAAEDPPPPVAATGRVPSGRPPAAPAAAASDHCRLRGPHDRLGTPRRQRLARVP